MNNQNFIRKN